MMQTEPCLQCGGRTSFLREGSIQGTYCAKCGWQVVATHLPEAEVDDGKCRIAVFGGDVHNKAHVRAVAEVANVNLISARNLLRHEGAVVFEGAASQANQAIATLTQAGLRCDFVQLPANDARAS